jgi:hypothetical protein
MLDICLMTGIEIDKCTESWTVKIPEILKAKLDKLSSPQKAALKESILFVMAKHLHEADFNPEIYLTSRES